ncbi:MAG: hypothetical protein E7324_09740 [Clostridiales bacterium]|nr:hypothetical protein [Clostridiales bacterium]
MKDFPLFRSGEAGAAGTLLMAGPLLLFAVTPGMQPLAIVLILMALPMGLCVSGLACGGGPMAAGLLGGIGALYLITGLDGALLGAVYLLPIVIAFLVCILRRIPFWKSCAVMIGVHVASITGCYLILQQMAGGQLFEVAGDLVLGALEGWEGTDSLLYSFYQYGLIQVPDAMKDTVLVPVMGGNVLSDAARADMLLSLRALINNLVTTFVPSFLAGQSILGGVGSVFLSIRFGDAAAKGRDYKQVLDDKKELQAPDFPDLGMPPIHLWHLPRGMGWKVGVALIVGTLLQSSGSVPLAIAGVLLNGGATAIFTLQGVAMINFMQKMKGTRLGWRIAIPLILYMTSMLSIVGIFDQLNNFRGLRKPRQPKEEP